MSTPAATNIYDSIGGEPALAAVVDDLYQRVTADPELAGFFAGTNIGQTQGTAGRVLRRGAGRPSDVYRCDYAGGTSGAWDRSGTLQSGSRSSHRSPQRS